MAAAISVFVNDIAGGRPLGGLRVQIYWVEPQGDVLPKASSTTDAGTTASAMVSGAKLSAGTYKLVLHAGDYLAATYVDRPRCLDLVTVVFIVEDASAGRRVEIGLSADGYAVRFT